MEDDGVFLFLCYFVCRDTKIVKPRAPPWIQEGDLFNVAALENVEYLIGGHLLDLRVAKLQLAGDSNISILAAAVNYYAFHEIFNDVTTSSSSVGEFLKST